MAQAAPAPRSRRRSAATAGASTTATATRRARRPRATAAAQAPTGPQPTLRILETRTLRGPNYWSRQPVIRMLVDLGVLEAYPSNKIPGFTDALIELLPSLDDHACSLGRRGGFIARLREGTWTGHIAEHIALELQNLAGTDVRHGKTRSTGEPGHYNVIYEFREESVGLEAGRMAVGLVNHLVAPNDPAVALDLMAELERLILLAERQAFGPSTQAILDEAASRDVPYIRLDRFSLVQLGQGVHQERIRATMTSRTSGIAVDVASDSRSTATTAGASTSTSAPRRTSAPRSRRPSPRPAAGTSSSRRTSTATTTAAS
jgi:cyanophycin synthetase